MNLIALKDIARVGRLKKHTSNIKDLAHDGHVHKGATFSIGEGKTLAEMKDLGEADELVLVAQLIHADAVGPADDTKVVAAVKAEVAADKKREEAIAKREQAAGNQALVGQLTALLEKAAK